MGGYQAGGARVPAPAPAVMQDKLRTQFGDQVDITVSNEGINGRAAVDLVTGTDGVHLPWVQTAAISKARIVIFNYAINDAGRGTPLADYKTSLTTLVMVARQNGKIPVLEEPNPVCLPVDFSPKLDTYVQAMREVSNYTGAALIRQYDEIKAIPGWQSMEGDCTHPSQPLYTIKGQREAAAIAPIVASLLK